MWLFLHSGSRGVRNRIAGHHIAVAQRQAKQWWIELPDPDLAYLVEGTPEFTRYIRELRWAQHCVSSSTSRATEHLSLIHI